MVERTASELSLRFTEQLERTTSEHPARTELAQVTETNEMHSRALTELVALPGLLEQLQQEVQTVLAAHSAQYRTPRARNFR